MATITGADIDAMLGKLDRVMEWPQDGPPPPDARGTLEAEFDARLRFMLLARDCDIHHLESGTKARIIRRRDEIISRVLDGAS